MVPMSLDQRVAVAGLVAALMAACSPSSALAVVDECRARGRFTSVMMGTTILLDFVVILVFNCAQALADATLSSRPVDGGVVGVVVAQLAISACGGVLLGGALVFVVFWRGRSCARRKNRRAAALQQGLKKVLLLACAALVFIASHVAHPWVEPLLACLVAGFVVTNHTRYGHEFGTLLHGSLGAGVYVFFFTLTGAAMYVRSPARSLLNSAFSYFC